MSSAGSSASSKVHIANSKYNPRLKEGEYEDSGSSAKNGRDKRKRSAASGRRGRVNDASDGMRQMDIASSFKAGTQRALIDSARCVSFARALLEVVLLCDCVISFKVPVIKNNMYLYIMYVCVMY